MKNKNTLRLILSNIIFLTIIVSCLFINTDNKSKNFIIKNKEKIRYIDNIEHPIFIIDSLSGYYTDVSIKLIDDKSYSVVFWGNRKSWLWDYKLDYHFTEDLNYNKYKNVNIDKDLEILNILKSIK